MVGEGGVFFLNLMFRPYIDVIFYGNYWQISYVVRQIKLHFAIFTIENKMSELQKWVSLGIQLKIIIT